MILTFCPHAPIIFHNVSVNVAIIPFYYLDLYVVLYFPLSFLLSLFFCTIVLWIDLLHSVTNSSSLYSFKHNINQHLSAL